MNKQQKLPVEIKYVLSFPTSLVYHIFAQIDFQKEWGDASLFCFEYIEWLQKEGNTDLVISENKRKEIKTKLNKYFSLLTFACLRPWYIDLGKLTKDFSDLEFIGKKIENYPNLSSGTTKETFFYLLSLVEDIKETYTIFWNENLAFFNQKIKEFEVKHKDIFIAYYTYLHNQMNQEILIKENFYIFMIPSLFSFGRGLEGGCAVGIPFDEIQLKRNIALSMHELTHAFSNALLIKFKFISNGNDEMSNHQLKEQLAEYILQKYLKQFNPDLALKEIITFPLLTEEIKGALGK